jgi:ketosteroid isomerase-like protein
MKLAARFIAVSVALFMAACHPAPVSQPASSTNPAPGNADTEAVLAFLNAYGRRDLEAMMKHLDEEAVFRGSGSTLSKAQIREFFQTSFQKHPNLRVEIGPLKQTQGKIHVSVKVETNIVWADTWLFELKNHRIHAYSLASGRR